MAYEFILSERQDNVAVITLNRPEKLNALSFGLVSELDEALTEYEKDEAVKAVILTGAGERAFSAGADIHEMAGLTSEELARISQRG
jgi:enoyl-CoA hydratase/carnithine racemase